MNPDDKVTLEWLMRFEGAVQSDVTSGNDWYEVVTIQRRGVDNLGINGRKYYSKPNNEYVMMVELRCTGGFLTFPNPTIARFHEAVAFLGATLPPLRPGEA